MSRTSSQVYPSPTIIPDFVTESGSILLARASNSRDWSKSPFGRTRRKTRRTVSMLWFKVLGLAAITVSRLVWAEDISSTNTVCHTQIAEARISYGWRGDISAVQKTTTGQSLLEHFGPF